MSRSAGLHQRLLLEQISTMEERQLKLQTDVNALLSSREAGAGLTDAANSQTDGSIAAPGRKSSALPCRSVRHERPEEDVAGLKAKFQELGARVDILSSACAKVDEQVVSLQANVKNAQSQNPAQVASCSGCARLATEIHSLQDAVLSMASHAQPCTRWSVQVQIKMETSGRLQLLSSASSPYYWSGPLNCGHQVYTSTVLRTLTQLGAPRVAPGQIGSVELSVNVIGSSGDWPKGRQNLRISFPNTLMSTTDVCFVELPRAEPSSAGKRRTVQTISIPILLPASAELGAILDWTYETELCVLWATAADI